MDALRASMVKQVFSREHFTHKKGLLFTPSVHTDEGFGFETDKATLPTADPDHAQDDAVHATSVSAHDAQSEKPAEHQSIEDIRAQAFAEGLAQGLEEGQVRANQAQADNAQAQLAAQSTADTQALLQEIDQKVDALMEDPAQLQEPLKRLALHLAEQLVLGDLSLSPQAVEHLIERCIETLDAPDASALVVELNAQDLALLQNQQRAEGQPKPAWRLQADHSLLPGSVRVRADDAVVSDLIENRLESLAHSLLQDPQAWQANSAFAPSKLASRLSSQRGSAHTVEDAQAKPRSMNPSLLPQSMAEPEVDTEMAPFDRHEAAQEEAEDFTEKHTYEAHEVMASAAPPHEAATKNFADALSDISLELDKLHD
jgi:flagellar biosynthesis/type III secretory pathway protein FliH